MPKSTDKSTTRGRAGTNPNVSSGKGGINPSAPTTGTEGWGNTSDERRVLSNVDPAGTRAGQMKGNPGDNMTEASQQASERATTNKKRSGNSGSNQAELSRRTSAGAHSMNTGYGGSDHTLRCADLGNSDCQWETSGRSEDEVMRNVVEHARTDHGMTDWSDALRNKVRDNIHRRQAA